MTKAEAIQQAQAEVDRLNAVDRTKLYPHEVVTHRAATVAALAKLDDANAREE